MESSTRVSLATVSGKNKKLQELLVHREAFLGHMETLRSSLPPPAAFAADDCGVARVVEGRDISVCIRVRPLLPYESDCGYFPIVHSSNPKVCLLEPRLDFRRNPRPLRTEFEVDFAFGPEHGNAEVYSSVATQLVDLGLNGGVCTMLAYGQTGSGKTHTIEGILDRIAGDLFDRRQQVIRDGQCSLKMHLSFFELLGNDVTDLLHPDKVAIEIMEDKFGKIVVRNATEVEVVSPQQFTTMIQQAMQHRRTQTTFKNDTSSRSHAVCSVRIENTLLKEVEDGRIFIIDLAGSENSADAQFHDRSLIKETQLINKSLMALKDCIRHRALSALNPEKYYHIPFRLSRLTLLLKEAFEVESHRHCKTVVFACVSPSCADAAMTMNTLNYVTPIRIGQSNREKIIPNPKSPASWDNEQLRAWVTAKSRGQVNPEVLCPFENGMQLLRLPEIEFIRRVLEGNSQMGEKKAKMFYTALWKLLIDARTLERKKKLKLKKKTDKVQEWSEELLEREAQNRAEQAATED